MKLKLILKSFHNAPFGYWYEDPVVTNLKIHLVIQKLLIDVKKSRQITGCELTVSVI